MRREIFIHFAFFISFFILISIFKNYLALSYWPFWVGGLIGTLLPDVDHLIYIFFLNPQDLTSQRVSFLIRKREVSRVISLLYETRSERKNLVFHSFLFQIIFFVLTFFIVSSSTSILARGLVLAFSMHMMVDQLADIFDMKSLTNWGRFLSNELSYRNSIIYLSASLLLVCLMGFLM